MLSILIILFMLTKNNIYNNINKIFVEKHSDSLNLYDKYKYNGGIDERYLTNKTHDNNYFNYKMMTLYKKQKLFTILKNEKISINEKLELLEDNSVKAPDLFAGGLFKDSDFDFVN